MTFSKRIIGIIFTSFAASSMVKTFAFLPGLDGTCPEGAFWRRFRVIDALKLVTHCCQKIYDCAPKFFVDLATL